MKILIGRHSKSAGTLVMVFMVVSVCVIVGMGGCAAYKLKKKIQKREEYERTNVVEEAHVILRDYKAQTGENSSKAYAFDLAVLVPQDSTPTITVQSSTNLVDWADLLQTTDPAVANLEILNMMTNRIDGPSCQFFRLKVE